MRLLLTALLVFVHLAGLANGDSTRNAGFEKLANKMRLGTPKRQDLAYEVRIWHDQSFQYGDAQQLYRLIKTKYVFSLTKYIIKSGRNGFKSAKKIEPTVPITDSLWKQVVQLGILNMPDEKIIESKLRPIQQNNPGWRFDPDSTVTIYNSKIERSVYILDGEGYHFEIFNADNYRNYTYNNPYGYNRAKPEIPELQNVVGILELIKNCFPNDKK